MNEPILLYIPCKPKPNSHGKRSKVVHQPIRHIKFYKDKRKNELLLEIGEAVNRQRPRRPLKGLLFVRYTVMIPRPERGSHAWKFLPPELKRALKNNGGRMLAWDESNATGDWDNYAKSIGDCLSRLKFWKSDGQICGGTVTKLFCATWELPGIDAVISRCLS